MAGNDKSAQVSLFDGSEFLSSVTSLAPGGATPLMKDLDYTELIKCMRCGYCLAVCPTYQQTHNETASPRGRIGLVQALAEGALPLDRGLEARLDLCLGCRACETACPAGVSYGHIKEDATVVLRQNLPRPWWVTALQNFLFDHVFLYPRRLRQLVNLLWLYQRSGLRSLVKWSGVLKLFPGNLSGVESLQPIVAPPSKRRPVPVHGPKWFVDGEAGPRVGLFRGCIMEAVFSETNWSTFRMLDEAGCEVISPVEQTCCGALHAHTGDMDTAREAARRNIEVFEAGGVDYVVVNAAGCGAMLKDYHHLLEDDPVWHERALDFVKKVRDLSELLAELRGPREGEFQPLAKERMKDLGLKWWPHIVTYQDACHLAHGQGIREQPRELIEALPVETRPLPNSDTCCGSAGVYNIVQYDMSMKILDKKMEDIKKTGADTVVTANPGCHLQLQHGIHRHGLDGQVQVVHIADLLEAFSEAGLSRRTQSPSALLGH